MGGFDDFFDRISIYAFSDNKVSHDKSVFDEARVWLDKLEKTL